jgi:putative DNA primase/helicase
MSKTAAALAVLDEYHARAPGFTAVTAGELLAHDFPPRENLLAPWLPRQGLGMIFAPRGIGKTHFSLGVAVAVASGGTFLNWQAPRPAGVLFLDGEMPGVVLQERLAAIVASTGRELAAPLRFVTPDLQAHGTPNLADPLDQERLEPLLDGVALVIVDNIATCCHGGRENETEGWLPVQGWALRQRAAGRSVLFVHHAGKSGNQRGASSREDVLDTVVSLKRPGDYDPAQGARFVVTFEKSRGFHGDAAKGFEASLTTDAAGAQAWAVADLEDSTLDQVVALLRDEVPQADIARELQINRSTVSRHAKRARQEGLL